ncbi:MAG: FlgD immunoglobulin-like domain containing protein, partial [bacterium]
ILPVMTGGDLYIWVLWQSDRNADWDIYGSYIFVGGVEESNACDIKTRSSLIVDPNPFRQKTKISLCIGHPDRRTRFSYGTGRAEGMELKIYDATGRVVKNFSLLPAYSILPTTIFWDGTDNSGFRLPAGVYFVRLENESEALTEKVVLIE